jgi:S-adenosylmethionine:tRNA ribosyltransferase-isomerase
VIAAGFVPETHPRRRGDGRLLRIDPCGDRFGDARIVELPEMLRPGDLVIVNDAATAPASFRARVAGVEVELRLAAELTGDGCRAVLFGAGDWRTPTEHRPAPPPLAPGARLVIAADLGAVVTAVSTISPRLVTVRFDPGGDSLPARLFAHGRPVQYSHVDAPLELWDVQTAYGSRPWAVEAPSAGLALDGATLLAFRRHGVVLARLTHAAGLSSTGDVALDAALPLPELYDIPAETVAAIEAARGRGGRVVAVGTTVVRALEGAVRSFGALRSGAGVTDLRIRPGFRPRVVDGLLTGLHEPGSSHLDLLRAFVPPPLLDAAYAHAAATGYHGHELGDASLILCG